MSQIRQTDKAFGLTFAAVFTVIFAVGWLVFDARLYWAPWTAALLLAVAVFRPVILLPFNRLWARFARQLGIVNNYLLMGLFYYVLIAPLGVLLRLCGWDPLHRTADPGVASYWTKVSRSTTQETLRDMF